MLAKLSHMAEGIIYLELLVTKPMLTATEFNVAVLMVRRRCSNYPTEMLTGLKTNQVQSDPGASALFASADG